MSARRLRRELPLFAFSLLPLIAGAAHAGPVLPTAGKVVAGSASIGAPTPGSLVINQSSAKAIIDWSGFSIGAGGKVVFDNGKGGATLNRVTGRSVSSLDGLLTGTGSVYVINPNGVIVGRNGVVNVGGTFVASTLDTPDAAFLKGGDLSFTGASSAAVVNYGRIGALGGDVALIAQRVSNAGSIAAANGDAGLLAGTRVVLSDASLDDGRFSVELGARGFSVTNSGLIAAADAELRAENGNVYALAGNTAGTIRATGVKSGGGKVWLVAQGGTTEAAGTIDAQGVGGTAGAVETSGQTVNMGKVAVNAHGGTWLLDPDNLEITQSDAQTISDALGNGTSVTEETTASGTSGAGTATSGAGDITLDANATIYLNGGTPGTLTLSAYRNIDVAGMIAEDINATSATIVLRADNSGTGVGTIEFSGSGAHIEGNNANVSLYYNPTGNSSASVNSTSYTTPTDFSGAIADGATLTAYMLVNTVFDLQNVQNNLSGTYALGRDIDASATANTAVFANGFNPIGESGGFSGLFDGQGHVVSGLTVSSNPDSGGLFSGNDGTIRNIGLLGGSVDGDYAGDLAGTNTGTITNAYATGSVRGDNTIGGLVGESFGTITNAYATGSVTGEGNVEAGGFVGRENGGTITNAYSTGLVSAPGGGYIAGFAGVVTAGGVVTNTFFDNQTSGQSSGAGYGSGPTGLTTAQFMDPTSAISGLGLATTPGGTGFVIVDADGSLNGAGGEAGATRPFLLSEYQTTITNAHQLQLMALDTAASYTLGGNVDASETAAGVGAPSGTTTGPGMWGTDGFVPIGVQSGSFTGTLDGAGYTISGLTIADAAGTLANLGLFSQIGAAGVVKNLTLTNASVTGSDSTDTVYLGLLAGQNAGTIDNVTAVGGVAYSGTDDGGDVGGLVGHNTGSISGAYTTATVNIGSGKGDVGGLVGFNDTGGAISGAYATGVATGFDASDVGGLVGENAGSILNAYASSEVVGANAFGAAGGLVGDNDTSGTITDAYATGYIVPASSGPASLTIHIKSASIGPPTATESGGLVGENDGTVTNGYYDTDTTGQSDTNGGSTPLTTGQLMAGLPAGFSSTVWSILPGISYPYLAAQFPGTPQAVRGVAYAASGGAVLPGATVGLIVNGTTALSSTTTGANGDYYTLLPQGTLPAGSTLLSYLAGATDANGAAVNADAVDERIASPTTSAIHMRLEGGALTLATTDTSLSSAVGDLSLALGSATASLPAAELTFTGGAPIPVNSTLYLQPLGASFAFNENLDLGAGVLQFAPTAADITQVYGVVTAYALSGQVGSLNFGDANAFHEVSNFGFTDATGLRLNNATTLRVGYVHPIGMNAGGVDISTSTGALLDIVGRVSNGPFGVLTLASSGRLVEGSAGELTATMSVIAPTAALTASSVGGLLLGGANNDASVSLMNTGAGSIVLKDQHAVVAELSDTTGAATITDSGQMLFEGQATVGKGLTLTAGEGIELGGATLDAHVVTLIAENGGISDLLGGPTAGKITATALTGSATGQVALNDGVNHVSFLEDFSAQAGFAFSDAQTLRQTGTLNAGAGTTGLTVTNGDLVIQGMVDAGTLNLTTQAGALREASNGAIVTNTLNATASSYIDLEGSGNDITTLGTISTGRPPAKINQGTQP